ncbi:MAG: glutamate synthase [Planctomycetes bacterium]|nr:glutamate synthase [Planctomycetota bacterium]
MSELVPLSLERLTTRMMREIGHCGAVFDLPLAKCFLGSPDHDLGVRFHGRRAATPLGPAAGPHSQMAQNIALSWLAGSRIIELKTVQVMDELEIPRPCIDMRTVGYNVEWSQELRLEQSAEEYVKGAMLVTMLADVLGDRLAPGFDATVFDMSVGYDLAGIRGPAVRRFIETMLDASALVDRLRNEIPAEHARLRDLDFPNRISGTLTLSTFHGCPSDEIERILEHLMREHALNVIVKLNPTLLGPGEVDHLLHDVLGYREIRVPRPAFERDTTWEQACGFVERLRKLAGELGLGFGVKLTNTLIVGHDGDFLPHGEKEKYLSGAPLHVLAMRLVQRFRERFGPELPISFSAGVDRHNFADAVALGLTPITVCTDLLRTGGYTRAQAYFRNLLTRMDAVGVRTVDDFITNTAGETERPAAVLHNTTRYVEQITGDRRYTLPQNTKPPPKIGSSLELFNCITCDKCIPVCPNDANFALRIPPTSVPVLVCRKNGDTWRCEQRGTVELTTKHQIANYADFCNDCGNCDVFCPEDGGPYVIKPRFFGSVETFERFGSGNGFMVERDGDAVRVRGRFDAGEFSLVVDGRSRMYRGVDFEVTFDADDPPGTIAGSGSEVDLTYALILDLVQRAVLDEASVNYVGC